MFATTAQELLAAGNNASAVDISRMGRRIDDTVEAFYQAQISAHIQMDEPAEARRVYDTCLKVTVHFPPDFNPYSLQAYPINNRLYIPRSGNTWQSQLIAAPPT